MIVGIVYLLTEWIADDKRYKIGNTKNTIEKRLKQLQTGNSNEISIVNTFSSIHYKAIENMLHKKYHGGKLIGEWFHISDEEVLAFTSTCQSLHDNIDFLKKHNYYLKNNNK